MKAILLALSFLFIAPTFSGEITGVGRQALNVLEGHQLDLASLQRQGYKVLLGEITGVGKSIHLDRVEMVVTKRKLFQMRQLSHVEYIHPSEAKTLNDVAHLEFNNNVLRTSQIAGVVYK